RPCRRYDRPVASRRPLVVIEETSKPRTAANPSVGRTSSRAVDKLVAQPLMIPFVMIVRDVFGNSPSEMPFADRNDPIKAFLYDRSHEAFGVRIRIGRLKRRLHYAESGLLQSSTHGRTPLRVSVTD